MFKLAVREGASRGSLVVIRHAYSAVIRLNVGEVDCVGYCYWPVDCVGYCC